jgi:hypothetical protein
MSGPKLGPRVSAYVEMYSNMSPCPVLVAAFWASLRRASKFVV